MQIKEVVRDHHVYKLPQIGKLKEKNHKDLSDVSMMTVETITVVGPL